MSDLTPEKLKELYIKENLTQKEIAQRFDLTQACISKRMKRWEIESNHNGFWSETEIQILRDHYPDEKELLVSEIDRSWNSIKLKAMDLGLARNQDEYCKSEERIEHLRELAHEKEIEPDIGESEALSYFLGVIDGDGFHNKSDTIGLETNSERFAEKFAESLATVGLNPGNRKRRGKVAVWACSKQLVDWIMELGYREKHWWLESRGEPWGYIEGLYDSDGCLRATGNPLISCYKQKEKDFTYSVMRHRDLECSKHKNKVYVKKEGVDKFFENVDPVYDKRAPEG